MDCVELEHSDEHASETMDGQLLSLNSPATSSYGDPSVLPRIGDQYQAEMPPLMTESEQHQLRTRQKLPNDVLFDSPFEIGLAIPIVWVPHRGDHIKDKREEFSRTNAGADEAASVDATNSKQIPMNGSRCQEFTTLNNQMNMESPWMPLGKVQSNHAIPGSPTTAWSNAEIQSFLLGLYIFGKNLVLVRKFIECKGMADILSYYYGKFCKSDAHRRWAECRKIRTRRSIHGQRIFTGCRQQEFLSRVLPTKSKEVQDTVQEVIRALNEGRASLEESVFALKAAVGMQVLVEAVGIGKGKYDLTGIVLDPIKTNHFSGRSELPSGKACSTLTSRDIIKFLTGDFRLSKAKSNDLFWEAVWPRLLAKGWHSEQPKDYTSVGSKHALVFLLPGIRKFSRRKLVKGNHYFDSVSDVLKTVAEDPKLLELETDEVKGSSENTNEYGVDADTRTEQNGQRHSYLRPRIPNCNSEFMKFTVVDTSLFQGETPFKVTELRSLPVPPNSFDHSISEETESDSSEEQQDSPDILVDGQEQPGPCVSDLRKLGKSNKCIFDKRMRSTLSDDTVNAFNDKCPEPVNNKKVVKDVKRQFNRMVKSEGSDYSAPVQKRQRSAPSSEGTGRRGFSLHKSHQSSKETHGFESSKACDFVVTEPRTFSGTLSLNSSTKISPYSSSEYAFARNHHGANAANKAIASQEKPQPRAMIDLNLPVQPDFDTVESFCKEVGGSCQDLNQEKPLYHLESSQQHADLQPMETSNSLPNGQQPSTSSRRQSTRNRPPTAKALEALACGFIGTKQKGRGTKDPLLSNFSNGYSRRARRSVETPVPAPDASSTEFCSGRESDARMDEWRNNNANNERRGNHELLGIP